MSIEISTRVWKQSKQKGTHKLFLLALADHANGDGYCYPGIERISEWCNVNERQGRRISADLQTDGEILVKVGGGRFGTNEYIITAGMGSDELEKTIVKYFKVSKKDAYEMVQDLLKRQYDAANTPPENPVLETPPVMQDQNPVMQGRNPVLEDRGTVINRQEPKQQKGDEPKVNAYAAYNSAFGEPIPNPTSPRTINAVEDLEEYPQDWLEEAFLRTSKRERSANERWKDYQRYPYALSILNEWKHAGRILPEVTYQSKPTYAARGKTGSPRAPAEYIPPTEAERAAFRAQLARAS